jgi:hypothetical protein
MVDKDSRRAPIEFQSGFAVARNCRRTRRSTSPLWLPAFRIEIVPLSCFSAEFTNTVLRNAVIVAQFLKRHGRGGITRPRQANGSLAGGTSAGCHSEPRKPYSSRE